MPIMETAMRESLNLFRGDVAKMIFRPIAGTIYLLSVLALLAPPLLRLLRKKP